MSRPAGPDPGPGNAPSRAGGPDPGPGNAYSGKNTDTLALTEGLAADAAGILERDYGIDAGEVLSMNVDTVETVESQETTESVTEAATPESIKANYRLKWFNQKAQNSPHGSVQTGVQLTDITDHQDEITDWFAIDNLTINGLTRPTIRLLNREYTHRVFIDNENYVNVPKSDSSTTSNFKATYEAVFGATNEFGVTSTNICGEATYWFKLDADCQNGYGITFDNHTGCGYFSNNDNQIYLVKMENRLISAVDYTNYTAQFVNFKQYPEYGIKITEDNGNATIEIWPNNSKAGLNDKVINGSGEYSTANTNRIKWENIDVSLYDTDFTQAYDFWDFDGIYFADCKVTTEQTVIKEVVKSFGDIVYEPNWTDGALHMLINMDTASDSTMLGKDNGTESSTRLLDNGKRREIGQNAKMGYRDRLLPHTDSTA